MHRLRPNYGFVALKRGVLAASIATAAAGLAASPTLAVAVGDPGAAVPSSQVAFARASEAARLVADWAVVSADHGRLPFLIVDKIDARVYVFEAEGTLRGSAPVLLGSARGDHTVPGIGERAISAIGPHERTTPAGRFVAEPGHNSHGEDIVWVDYDAAVSMHRLRANDPREKRRQRLRSPTPEDNRISYGCINVPATFYDRVVKFALRHGKAIVYVLPETQTAQSLFGIDG